VVSRVPPTIFVLAGPNGAGKTTFARSFLPQEANCQRFINADLIAAGLSPFAPEAAALRAGRLMLREMESCAKRRESFAFETTLSGLGYLARFRQWRSMGHEISLYFLALPNAETAILRVAARVKQGGLNVPEPVIRRRFTAGLHNFENIYKPEVDRWIKFDSVSDSPALIEWGGPLRET
jgi:predicted ABC-type ATPase